MSDHPELPELLVRFRPDLVRYTERHAGGVLRFETAEDLVQGAHLRALEYASSFDYRGREPFLKWMYEVARSHIASRRAHWAALKRSPARLLRMARTGAREPRSMPAGDVARLLGGLRPHLMVTDPPYGVAYDPAWRNAAGLSATKRTGKVMNDDRADWREAWALFPGEVAYVWHGALHAAAVAASLEASGFAVRSQIIWAKERLVLSRGDYHWQHEPCWYAVRRKGRGHWAGDRKQTTLWTIASREQDAATVHGTQKPVEAMRRPMLNNSSPGQAVYEPFCGSGTSIVAAETCGRSCLALELDPAYVDVAVTRWQDFTGEVAVLEGDGRGFIEIAAERTA